MSATSYEYLVSRRYLNARSRRAFISLITFLSTVGIAMGVMVMIVVIAVMSGAEAELKNRLLGITAHGVLMRHGGLFQDYESVLKVLREDPRIEAATPIDQTSCVTTRRSTESPDSGTGMTTTVASCMKGVLRSSRSVSATAYGSRGVPSSTRM